MDKVAEIKQIYLNATRATIARDVDRAIAILKSMESDEERERAAVYMDGLAEMRSDWGLAPSSQRSSTGGAGRRAQKPPSRARQG